MSLQPSRSFPDRAAEAAARLSSQSALSREGPPGAVEARDSNPGCAATSAVSHAEAEGVRRAVKRPVRHDG